MGRRPRVDRSPEEKWQIVQEGIKSGNVSETCRRHGISPSLLYRWRDEAEAGAKAALGGKSAAAGDAENLHNIAGGRSKRQRKAFGTTALQVFDCAETGLNKGQHSGRFTGCPKTLSCPKTSPRAIT